MSASAITVLLLLSVDAAGDPRGAGPPPAPPAPASRSGETSRSGERPAHARPALDPGAMRRLSAEDPPLDLLRAAASALVLAEPERARSLVRRARWSAWLPEVRFRVDRRFGRSESLDVSPVPLSDAPPVSLDTVDEVRYEWRATWDLSRLIFNPDELAAHSEALRMADVRREVESVLIHLYFERRRLKIEALTADSNDVVSSLRRDMRIEELEAELDALTGGAFSRAVAVRGGAPPPPSLP